MTERTGGLSEPQAPRLGARRWLIALAPVVLLCVLVTATWWPALFEGKTLLHGDSVFVGIVQAKVHADVLAGLQPFSWTREMYGGHPFFAEGQVGFYNPVNIFFAAFVSPRLGFTTSASWLHWVYMILASAGFIGLARTLGLSAWAQLLAGVAAIFSSAWVQSEQNSTFAATMATVPWALWAFEVWLERPTVKQAILLGAVGAWMVSAGYPQIAYGAVLYMAASVLPGMLQSSVRTVWLNSWRARALTGAIALVIGLGVAAIYLAPLVELVGYSQRLAGTDLVMVPNPSAPIRGALFWPSWNLENFLFPTVGSILVCILASMAPLLDQRPRLIGHVAGVVLLTTLGLGPPFPLFTWIYDRHLLPGLHYFRIMHPFFLVAMLGIGLLIGYTADAIARAKPQPEIGTALRALSKGPRLWLSLLIMGIWTALAVRCYVAELPRLTIWLALAAGIGAPGLFVIGRVAWIAPLLTGLLCMDAVGQRIHPYPFFDTTALSEPQSVKLIRARPDWRDYKHSHLTSAETFGFTSPTFPGLGAGFQKVKTGIVASTNILWDIPSMRGAFALPLARRQMLDTLLAREWQGTNQTPAGLRLTDILGIRFLTFDTLVNAPGYRVLLHDSAAGNWLMENTAARTRFQFYSRHIEVDSPEAALPILSDLDSLRLVVETPAGGARLLPLAADAALHARYDLLEDRGDRYRLRVTAQSPVWLFLADANYPGWRAAIDGASTPVYSAQILGKAVLMPAGDHELVLEFRSISLRWGAWITATTLVLAIVAVMYICKRHRAK